MMKSSIFSGICAAAGLLLFGCASGPQVSPEITGALAERGVTGATYERVENAQRLGYNYILTLVQRGVPEHIIEGYLQSTQAVYNFTPAQLSALRNAGAAPQLVNYLQETRGFYSPTPPASATASRTPRPEEVDSPLYQDEQPFAYNEPVIDDWYNSAYEESLYSPFSFNPD